MKDSQFFKRSEDAGWELLQQFNDKLRLSNLGRTAEKSTFDASGVTNDGRKVAIEIKVRNMSLEGCDRLSGAGFTADTMFIEAHKVASMAAAMWTDDYLPLYVNFINNGVVLYILSQSKGLREEDKLRKIKSNGYGQFEVCKRYLLPLTDAWIYDDNYKLIRKP